MSHVTAHMLVGTAHTHHGGINPLHQLFLRENSRPVWVLTCLNEEAGEPPVTWIPSIEHILEDGLLMIGLYLLKDETLRGLAGDVLDSPADGPIEVCEVFSEEVRNRLYAAARQMTGCKIVLSILKGSSIWGQCGALEDYGIEVELCKSG